MAPSQWDVIAYFTHYGLAEFNTKARSIVHYIFTLLVGGIQGDGRSLHYCLPVLNGPDVLPLLLGNEENAI